MKTKELRILPNNELEKRLAELRLELMKDQAQVALGATPKNPGRVSTVKKAIARIITLLSQKQVKQGLQREVK